VRPSGIVRGRRRVLPSRVGDRFFGGLFGLGVGKPAGRLEQAVVIGAAAGAALEVDSRAGVHACRVFPCELQLDIGVEDFLAGGAARVPLLGA
jgi:hypothetical protein